MATIGSASPSLPAPEGFDRNSIPVDILATGEEFSFAGRIWSASDGFLRIFASVNLELGTKVELEFEACRTAGEIVFSQQWPGGYNIGVQLLTSASTRREPRFPIQATGTLSVIGDQGPTNLHIDLRDVSASGLGMVADAQLPVGVCVEVKLEHGILFGEIRHSEKIDGGYRTGLKMFLMISRDPAAGPSRPSGILGWFRRHS